MQLLSNIKILAINRKKTYQLLIILLILFLGTSCNKEKRNLSSKDKPIEFKETKNYEILVTGGFNMYQDLSYAVPLIKFSLTDSLLSLKFSSGKTIKLKSIDSILPLLIKLSDKLNNNLNSKNLNPYHFHNPYFRPSESIDLIKHSKEKTERKQISGSRFTKEKNINYLELDSTDLKISYYLHKYLILIAKDHWKDSISTQNLNEVFSISKALENPESVYKLNLRGKRVKSIPPEIGKLKNLEVLVISGSTVKSISKEIENCKKLKSIIANASRLTELPSSLGNLKNLRTLKVDYCNLKSIPKEIGNIESLWELSIGHNKIEKLPNELTKLKNLTWLDISNNHFGEFPNSILQMENLKRFWMFGNNIKKIPFEINKLKYLDHIRLNKKKVENIDSLERIMPEVMFLHNN